MLLLILLLLVIPVVCSAQGDAKLIFAGEVNAGNNYNVRHQSSIDTEHLFANVRDELNSGTATFAALGTVLIDVAGTPNHANQVGTHKLIRVGENYALTLQQAAFTTMNLANSHVADFGIEGLQTTSWAMRDNHIEYAGIKAIKEYTTFERDGIKFGFVAFGTSVHAPSMSDSTMIKKVVAGLKDQCDIVVVAFSLNETASTASLGNIYAAGKHLYMDHSTTFAHTCVDAGADVVYGNGHNLPQPLELYKDRLIVYGLGNFCTPYGTNYQGDMGVAPMVEAELFIDGTFISGKILSYRQKDSNGPQHDPTNEAVKIIKSQTLHLSPKTQLTIDDNGIITSTSAAALAFVKSLLKEAARHRGKPYRSGAMGPGAFDCSGFTSYVFAKMGIKLKRSSAEQYTMGTPVDRRNLRPGDLVFFSRASVRGVGHVGIVYSVDKKNNTFSFIHASSSRGVTIDNFSKSGYYVRRYIGARRVK